MPDSAAQTTGVVFKVAAKNVQKTLQYLDQRESGGYVRLWFRATIGAEQKATVLTYTALSGNPSYLGPAPNDIMIKQISAAEGKSGTNLDYCRQFYEALDQLGIPAYERHHLPEIRSYLA